MSETEAAENKPPISAYIRTLNEERMIAEVVRAALSLAREVILVDSGSTDRTIELAEAAGAVVHKREWHGNGGQKRIGEELATYDWVLDLDADEVITPEFTEEVKQLFRKGEPERDVYNTPLVNVPAVGKPWHGYGQAVRHKLYNKQKIRIPDHEAWDQFKIPVGMRVGKLKKPILHYAFDGSELLIQKLNKNSSTRARVLKPKPLPWLALRIIFGLPVYFGKRYFVNGLWRGGLYGFAFSLMSGFGRWLRDVKMYERIMKAKGKTLYTKPPTEE
ncbi:MAG: glycosyltransferase family 2 protein [Aquisalinus sp.]|nr:glycosyltransferase family 2 protein [Aquisalinus sp.]